MPLPHQSFLPQQVQWCHSDSRPSPFCPSLEELISVLPITPMWLEVFLFLHSEIIKTPPCANVQPTQIPSLRLEAFSFKHKSAFWYPHLAPLQPISGFSRLLILVNYIHWAPFLQPMRGQCTVIAPLLPGQFYMPVSHCLSYLRFKAASQGTDIHVQVFEQSCCPTETLNVFKERKWLKLSSDLCNPIGHTEGTWEFTISGNKGAEPQQHTTAISLWSINLRNALWQMLIYREHKEKKDKMLFGNQATHTGSAVQIKA